MNVAEAIYRGVAIRDGYYVEESDGYSEDMTGDQFAELVASLPCPYPHDDGYPLEKGDLERYTFLNYSYEWFLNLDAETQVAYLDNLGVEHHTKDFLETLNKYVRDVDRPVAGGKLPEYSRPGKRLLAYLEDNTDLNTSARFVARVLLDHYSQQNYAFPKQETLARLTGCSVRTVSTALKSLVDAKVIRVVKPYQYGERYAAAVYDFTAKTKKAMGWK
jgi:hypothetical protein